MNKLDFWAMKTPLREFFLKRIISRYFRDYFQQLKGKRVLEIGCGNGAGAKLIKKYFSPKKVVAIDLDPRMVRIARNNVKNPSVLFEEGDATKLRYRDRQFEAVFDFITIHHIPGPKWKSSLKEVRRVLTPRGKLFLYETSIESFATFTGRILKLITTHPYGSMYTKKELVSYLKSLDFKILKEFSLPRHFVIVAEK